MTWCHHLIMSSVAPAARSFPRADRAICGEMPISNPSNIQPRNAARRTSHLPCGVIETRSESSGGLMITTGSGDVTAVSCDINGSGSPMGRSNG